MSKWIQIEAKDIEFTDEGIEIHVTNDYDGAIYADISYPVIKELFAKPQSKEKE